jgi:hypothetical protein
MRLGRWFALIGLMAGLGFAQVTQQSALWLTAYELGRRHTKLHELENDMAWLQTKLVHLRSPSYLVRVMKDRRLELVAWSALAPAPVSTRFASVGIGVSRDRRSD